MNGDFSRLTYRPAQHYSGVRLQQGRVLLDAEWNEQVDIQTYLQRTALGDLIGHCGAPWSPPTEFAHFQIQWNGNTFEIAAGHIYVDGILAVAEKTEKTVTYQTQPDYPNPPPLVGGTPYLVYLDLWERHLTALEQAIDEQPQIREVALGVPDTASRTRIIWQVKIQAVNPDATCADFGPTWLPENVASTGQLRAQAVPDPIAPNDCLVPEGGGYRRLENQLYRVEIHEAGTAGTATYKWSRENGSILAKLIKIDKTTPASPIITVADPGKDDVRSFTAGCWVEVSNEEDVLKNWHGVLLEGAAVIGDRITLKDPGGLLPTLSVGQTVRRWEGKGTVETGTPVVPKWLDLEDGVQIEFSVGSYVAGDYWTIPARTITGKVEWPQVANDPVPEKRHGINHHYCPLALLKPVDGTTWTATDCRPLFPKLTELTTLLYGGGDGQEALPASPLPLPLRVRVINGKVPVVGAPVQFTLVAGGGSLSVNAPVSTTAPDGIAECIWTVGASGPQQVQTVLLDASGNPVPGQIVDFNATVTIAAQVAYDPTRCERLTGAGTVQEALDKLCELIGNQAQDEEGIRIQKVQPHVDGVPIEDVDPIENDSNLWVNLLADGIDIVCDRNIHPSSVTNRVGLFQNAVCFITLNLPFPSRSQREDWNVAPDQWVLAFQPIILAATVSSNEDNIIRWRPTKQTAQWLKGSLFSAIGNNTHEQLTMVLARLTLKGNFIWGLETNEKNPDLYLDGDTFGMYADDENFQNHHTALKLPSGNSKRGGDFEMWFWLVQG